ncbi:MAG: cyclic nucleotide-binding domain-containing protein, partial [Anaerolineae bacterium]|nr:cyclic nucleotide-binding domain-containing protein [Anaerolineae bacterium]
MERVELLKNTFPGLTDDLAREMLSRVQEATYPAGVVLCHEGEREDTFYYILEGQVEILKWMEFTKENRHMRMSNAGNFFGEMGLISDAPRGATVRTTQQTTVLEMSRDDFLKLLSASPSMALAMVRTTIDRLRENDRMQFEELRKTYEALQKLDSAK